MSCVDINTGQSHFHYGLALLFEDEPFTVPVGNAVGDVAKWAGGIGLVFTVLGIALLLRDLED